MSDFFSENDKVVCKKCGGENEKSAKFCSSCGEKMEEVKPVEAEEVPSTPWNENSVNINYGQNNNGYGFDNQPSYYVQEQPKSENDMIGVAIASLVCGILALCCCYLGIPFAVAAIVTGIITITKKYSGKGLAIAGLITGGIAGIFWLLVFIIIGIGAVNDSLYNIF